MKSFINATIEKISTPTDEQLLGEILKALEKHSVFVGIPEEKAERKEPGSMDNATLLYIHTNGSAVKNIPSRPVIEPAIEDKENAFKLNKLFLNAALEGMKGNEQGMLFQLGRIGMAAQNMCRDWFTSPKNGWAPNQPATVKGKLRRSKMSKKKRKAAWEAYQAGEMIKGEPVDRPLIDTGDLRKSITYVVE